jgi:uncharacterized protein YeeX (DUF496 family)
MDRKDLKIQALLEKVSKLTTDYENQAADYRVEITMLSQQLQETQQELARVREASAETEEADDYAGADAD